MPGPMSSLSSFLLEEAEAGHIVAAFVEGGIICEPGCDSSCGLTSTFNGCAYVTPSIGHDVEMMPEEEMLSSSSFSYLNVFEENTMRMVFDNEGSLRCASAMIEPCWKLATFRVFHVATWFSPLRV